MLKIKRILNYISQGIVIIGAACGGGILVLVILSSVMRYFLGRPLDFSDELAGLLYFFYKFSVIPLATLTREHISLTFLSDRLPQRARDYVEVAGLFISLVWIGIFTKVAWDFSLASLRFGARTLNCDLIIWPWQIIMPIAMGLSALIVMFGIVEVIQRHIHRGKELKGNAK